MTWFTALKPWVRVVVAILIAGAAFFSVQKCYEKRQDSEAVWMSSARHWRSVPLSVRADAYEGATKSAMELWNTAAGCPLFAQTFVAMGDSISRDPLATVVVKATDGAPCGQMEAQGMGQDDAAGAYLCGPRAEVHVSHPGDTRQQFAIVAHELGHILGLAHDMWPGSVMYHDSGQVAASKMIRVTDKDSVALAKRYCR